MKTLFLLGILLTLVLIATKKPEQTAIDAAKELTSGLTDMAATVTQQNSKKPALKTKSNPSKRTIEPGDPPLIKELPEDLSDLPLSSPVPETVAPPEVSLPPINSEKEVREFTAQAPQPIQPNKTNSVTWPAPDTNGNVRSNLEQALNLLGEIK